MELSSLPTVFWVLGGLQIVLQIWSLVDLYVIKKKKTETLNAIAWTIIIIIANIAGPIFYFLMGRYQE